MLAAPDTLSLFGEMDRKQIAEEMAANPRFAKRLGVMLAQPDGKRLVTLSAMRAVANAFNPALYPDSKGEWITLRRRALELARALPSIVEGEVEKMPFERKMDVVRAIAAGGGVDVAVGVDGLADLGFIDILAPIVSSIAGAAANVYGAKVTASAQKDIAKIQAQAAMKDLETQMSIANAQQAIAAAQATQAQAAAQKAQAEAQVAQQRAAASSGGSVAAVLTKDVGGGIPLWTIPLALAGLGLILYFKLRR